MIKVLFVCHGNICRSPLAHLYFEDVLRKQGLEDDFFIDSAATSQEEIGNPVHPGTQKKLAEAGISSAGKTARQMTRQDYQEFDYLIGMDRWNIKNMIKIAGGDPDKKIFKLLEFAGENRDVADPWYTGDFDATWRDVTGGCAGFLRYLRENGIIG